MKTKIAIFGPQGSGKGTQAEILKTKYGFLHIYPGQIYRDEKAQGTELGKQVAAYTDQGKLVPNEITNGVIKNIISSPASGKGFILDGYPRNQNQMEALDQMTVLELAIVLELSDDEGIRRLGSRRVCSGCGKNYNLLTDPPKTDGVCDVCGQELITRDDDQPEAIKKRLAIYHESTKPLLDEYDRRGILRRVNGDQAIEAVAREVDTLCHEA